MPNRKAKERKRQRRLRHEALKKWKREKKIYEYILNLINEKREL